MSNLFNIFSTGQNDVGEDTRPPLLGIAVATIKGATRTACWLSTAWILTLPGGSRAVADPPPPTPHTWVRHRDKIFETPVPVPRPKWEFPPPPPPPEPPLLPPVGTGEGGGGGGGGTGGGGWGPGGGNNGNGDGTGGGPLPAGPLIWSVGSGIHISDISGPSAMDAGEGGISFSAGASDLDHWTTADSTQSGDEPDSVTYSWSVTGKNGASVGSITAGAGTSQIQWTAPGATGTYTVKCIVNDGTPIPLRDDKPVAVMLTVHVVKAGTPTSDKIRMWEPGSGIKALDLTGASTSYPSSLLTFKAEATDKDRWHILGTTGEDDDEIKYHWTCEHGGFLVDANHDGHADANADGTVVTAGEADTQSVTWLAPAAEGSYDVKCTMDDKPKAITGTDGGDRGDGPVDRKQTVKVQTLGVTWSGAGDDAAKELLTHESIQTLRACAGAVDDHVGDFQHRAHTRKIKAKFTHNDPPEALVNATVQFTFDANLGHDYGNGQAPKVATFHLDSESFDTVPWKEIQDATTDANGEVVFWVKSSDVIQKPNIVGSWKTGNAAPVTAGDLDCDFDEAVSHRGFVDATGHDADDTGWQFYNTQVNVDNETDFVHSYLADEGDVLDANIYMKFPVDPSATGLIEWQEVSGHSMKLSLASASVADHGSSDESDDDGTDESTGDSGGGGDPIEIDPDIDDVLDGGIEAAQQPDSDEGTSGAENEDNSEGKEDASPEVDTSAKIVLVDPVAIAEYLEFGTGTGDVQVTTDGNGIGATTVTAKDRIHDVKSLQFAAIDQTVRTK